MSMRIKIDQRWIDRLLAWPESGMGYQRVDVVMADGRELRDAAVLNAEWLEVPAEFAHATIANIQLSSDRSDVVAPKRR